ncbi:MAG: PilZ domain-containing protein [Pseudomonadota bacterium]
MPLTKNRQTERREYYRFEESLMMSYLVEADQQNSEELIANQYAMNLLDEFSSMSQQIKTSLSRVNNRSPEITSCFKILDSKINLLAQALLYKDKENSLIQHKANISAGGISFGVEKKIPVDKILVLELVLPPELNVLKIKAKVIKCSENTTEKHPYLVSTQFIETNDVTQDIIVRHIMRCQSDQLRTTKKID